MLNIFDLEKIDIADTAVKVVVRIAAAIIVIIAVKDALVEATGSFSYGVEAIEGMETQLEGLAYQEELFDGKKVVYGTISIIASDKGVKNVSISKVQRSLTEEEEAIVSRIAEGVEFEGESEAEMLEELRDRASMVDYYGMGTLQELFDIANAHLSEWR